MCPNPLIATAGSMKADARITEPHLSGARRATRHHPRYCLRTSVDGWLRPCAALARFCRDAILYIRNGLVTPTLGPVPGAFVFTHSYSAAC